MGQRKKTFTGCFTCRTRKIRCDLTKPRCQNCTKMGVECGGYGIKLRWLNPIEFTQKGTSIRLRQVAFAGLKSEQEFFHRRQLDAVVWKRAYTSYDEMDSDLAILHNSGRDQEIAKGRTKLLGPFGAFLGKGKKGEETKSPQVDVLVVPPHDPHDMWIAQELLQGAYITAAGMGNDQYLDNMFNEEFRFEDFDFYNLVFGNQDAVEAPPTVVTPLAALPTLDIHIHPHDDLGVAPILEIVETGENRYPQTAPPNVPSIHHTIPTTALQVQPLTRYLLNYYITEVADLMTVIPLTENPWKTIYFPRALSALGELAGLGHTLIAKNALLYALLAVLAFNLQLKFPSKLDEKNFYLRLGGRLRTQALYFVNQLGVDHCVKREKYKDVLCAIMLMISVDLVWGTMQGTHYHINFCGEVIQAKMQHKKKLSSKARILHRVFNSLKLIQDLTCLDPKQIEVNWGVGIRENTEPQTTTVTPEFVDNKLNNTKKRDENFATDALYGLPNSLIRLFAATVDMVRAKRYKGLVDEYDTHKLRAQLANWSLEWQLRNSDGGFLSDMHEATYYHIVLFHSALTIYFDRLILGVAVADVQEAVKLTLDHLNAVNNLIDKGSAVIIPLFWQGFIAGCEAILAELQQGFKQWGAAIAQYLGSYWGARQIMLEVWRRRNNRMVNDDWVHVIKDWNTNLMLN